MTGGDSVIARMLNTNPIEFRPQFKLYFNSNYQLRVTDETLFTSGRLKVIPFDRYFPEEEQDQTLKEQFAQQDSLNAIFKWLVEGYRLLVIEGLKESARVIEATEAYRLEMDVFSAFIAECTSPLAKARLSRTILHDVHNKWAAQNGYKTMNTHQFKADVERRLPTSRDDDVGAVVVGIELKNEWRGT
ncbi:hypothetical protein AGMMS49992_11600 [Clostridia bacterium]|nr:hypothetical protein AGMMS49992_11600 [Clostridia bacterium]